MRKLLLAPAVFAVFTLVYFAGFVFSDRVMVGIDQGDRYWLTSDPGDWAVAMGGCPAWARIGWDWSPTRPLSWLTTWHRYLGWRSVISVWVFACGVFVAARCLGMKRGAWFAGVCAVYCPALLSFILPGHEAKMLAIAGFPWGIAGLRKGGIWALLIPACVAWQVYAPHPQIAYLSLLALALLWLLWRGWTIAYTWQAAVLAVLLALPGTLGSYVYLRDTRVGADLAYSQGWSLHLGEVLALLWPGAVGYLDNYAGENGGKWNTEYFGIIVIVLAVVAVARNKGRTWHLALLALLALAFCLGSHTPVHGLLWYLVPGMKGLRAPGMAAFLFVVPALLLAGYAVDGVDWRVLAVLATLVLVDTWGVSRDFYHLVDPWIVPHPAAKWPAIVKQVGTDPVLNLTQHELFPVIRAVNSVRHDPWESHPHRRAFKENPTSLARWVITGKSAGVTPVVSENGLFLYWMDVRL